MIYRRHFGLSSSALGAKNRAAVLDAARRLAERGELPTTRAIGKMTGVYSTSTVAAHLESLAQNGDLVRYKYKSGAVYVPACECYRAAHPRAKTA